jgi:ATP adenylyltransferase/5',5'''-P-1,P-4-tetraphosphate phosphorylase II
MNEEVVQLFQQQLIGWELAKNNYQVLQQAKVKTFDVGGYRYLVQFNPARMVSSSAKVDAQSIRERKCFLCAENRPAEQKGIIFDGRYEILVNPFPIFPRHLTIPSLDHTPQQIISRFGDMLDLAQQLDDYIILYNGPKCGASAPDHFHFQAGNKGFLPIENDRNWRHNLRIESENKQDILMRFLQIYDTLPLQPDDTEPMMNILTWYKNGAWTTCIFPRKKHRPDCYFAEGDANMIISPASVDMGGMLITPLEKDFEKIAAEDIAGILDEVCFQE